MSITHRARQEWIEACHFHELTEEQVLREVARRVTELKARAGLGSRKSAHPLVLLDLDSTLYEVGPRTRQILHEWAEAGESAEFPEAREAVRRLEAEHRNYSLRDVFRSLGLALDRQEIQAAHDSAKRFWSRRFFTNAYLQYDRAYPGAAHFTHELYGLGAEIVYLTGCDEPGMGEGTRGRLMQDGFPWGVDRTHLLCKKTFEMDDLRHKQSAADYIREHGTLVASFENEPLNLTMLHGLFPEAMHVFVDTTCSENAAPVCQGLYRIRGFAVG